MKIYCLKCNKPTICESSVPNFCSHCGKTYIDTSIATASVPKSRMVSKVINKNEILEDYDENELEQLEKVPNIDKLEFNIDASIWKPNRQNGREVFNEGLDKNDDFIPRKKGKRLTKSQEKKNKENFKDSWRKEFEKGTRRDIDKDSE